KRGTLLEVAGRRAGLVARGPMIPEEGDREGQPRGDRAPQDLVQLVVSDPLWRVEGTIDLAQLGRRGARERRRQRDRAFRRPTGGWPQHATREGAVVVVVGEEGRVLGCGEHAAEERVDDRVEDEVVDRRRAREEARVT